MIYAILYVTNYLGIPILLEFCYCRKGGNQDPGREREWVREETWMQTRNSLSQVVSAHWKQAVRRHRLHPASIHRKRSQEPVLHPASMRPVASTAWRFTQALERDCAFAVPITRTSRALAARTPYRMLPTILRPGSTPSLLRTVPCWWPSFADSICGSFLAKASFFRLVFIISYFQIFEY